jgi:tryptophan-rich sensory protein
MSSSRGTGRSILALVLFLVIAFAVAALGSLTTIGNVDGWYADADKASWTPPNVVFGPVWTALYTVMSIAAWLVWRHPDGPERRRALAMYVGQLAVNAVWTPVFFGLYPVIGVGALWGALLIILALDLAVLLTVLRFWRVSGIAAVLLLPYGAWVLYATTLNAAAAVLNP